MSARVAINGFGRIGRNTLRAAVRDDADIDYLFAQVVVGEGRVDTTPNCGNMLAGVGPFAIETGLFPADEGTTAVRRAKLVNSFNDGYRDNIPLLIKYLGHSDFFANHALHDSASRGGLDANAGLVPLPILTYYLICSFLPNGLCNALFYVT